MKRVFAKRMINGRVCWCHDGFQIQPTVCHSVQSNDCTRNEVLFIGCGVPRKRRVHFDPPQLFQVLIILPRNNNKSMATRARTRRMQTLITGFRNSVMIQKEQDNLTTA